VDDTTFDMIAVSISAVVLSALATASHEVYSWYRIYLANRRVLERRAFESCWWSDDEHNRRNADRRAR
jgi:hypothetical protein